MKHMLNEGLPLTFISMEFSDLLTEVEKEFHLIKLRLYII